MGEYGNALRILRYRFFQLSIRRTFTPDPDVLLQSSARNLPLPDPSHPSYPSFTHRAGGEGDPTSRDREGSRAGAAPAHQDNGRARVQLPIGDARDQDDRGARHNRFVCRGAGEHWRRVLTYLRANGFKTFVVSGGGVDFMRPWADASMAFLRNRWSAIYPSNSR